MPIFRGVGSCIFACVLLLLALSSAYTRFRVPTRAFKCLHAHSSAYTRFQVPTRAFQVPTRAFKCLHALSSAYTRFHVPTRAFKCLHALFIYACVSKKNCVGTFIYACVSKKNCVGACIFCVRAGPNIVSGPDCVRAGHCCVGCRGPYTLSFVGFFLV